MDYQMNLQDARTEGEEVGIKKAIKMLKSMGISSKQASTNILKQYKDQLPEEEIKKSIREVYKD